MDKGAREITIRGVILGAILTFVFTAANVYAGLKVGLTFATSIPAAVISMAILRNFKNVTIQENNIVQTIASAAGTLSAIVFVLPGLLMIGWWSGFPYWQSVAVIGIGGVLGVMYSIPLRRALVTGSDLPYPEGVAAAEVLKVGSGIGGVEENRRGLAAVVAGAIGGAVYPLLAKLKFAAESASTTFRLGSGATTLSGGLSMMLLGVGHLVGLMVGISMLVGIVISFLIILPQLTAGGPPAGTELADFVNGIFRSKVRFIGAGTIGVAAIWTLLRVIGPILKGIGDAIRADRARKSAGGGMESLSLTERDIPIGIVIVAILVLILPIAVLFADFGDTVGIPSIIAALLYVLLAGLIIASVTGYMAGLVGASNSPVSGVGILTVLGISLVLVAIHGNDGGDSAKPLIAFALFVTALIFGVATIANDNLQDLKTGQLVGATPWRQQVALILGVGFGALVIPPVLDVLNNQYGFVGAAGAGEDALAAPQASLISSIAQGVLTGNLDWNLVGLGALIGIGAIIADAFLRKSGKGALPPLAVGLGMYLPMDITATVALGAVLGHVYNRWAARQANAEASERMGVLVATGLIVGDSLFNVGFAFLAWYADDAEVLAVAGESWPSMAAGVALFAAITAFSYHRMRKAALG
ncbi:MAG: OPT family oligopeptide transporter [Novosphingobium sp.]